MDNNIPRNHGVITDEEYRRLRQEEEGIFVEPPNQKEESDEPLNPDDEEENPEDLLPEPVEKDADGPVYDLRSDFFVVLPDQIIRISQSSNLSWLALFYALPKELVEKRPVYFGLPRNIRRLLNSEKDRKLIEDDAFLELVLDCYAWAIWQELKVPDGKGGYKDIPGEWQHYSGDFPIWRMGYLITSYFRIAFETELEWSFQRLFLMPENQDAPWMSWQHFSNLIRNLTDRIVEKEKLQPIIDEAWNNRQPEDYTGYNFKRGEFLRKWNHNRYHQHVSVERMMDDDMDIDDPKAAFDRKVLSEQTVEQFEATLPEKDRQILNLRMKGYTLQEIADIVDYETPSAVKKRIDKIAGEYEKFSNPIPENAERIGLKKSNL